MIENKYIFQIPTTDFSFKKIFGTEKNKRFLIHFLNCFVAKYTGKITDITYLPTEHYGATEKQRRVVFDILCTDQDDKQFIIEMQRARQPEFAERSIFYLSRAVNSRMKKGEPHYNLLPTYSVNILDFELPEYRDTDECFRVVTLKDQKNRVLTKKVAIFYINLCNFAAKQSDVTEEMRKWLNLLKNMPAMDEADYKSHEKIFRDVMDTCRISKLTAMEKKKYRESILEYEDVREVVEYAKELAAKEAYETGMAKGKEEGITEGIAKGIAEGFEKGKRETIITTAKNFLKLGIASSDIAKATGLSEDEISALKSEI